MALTILSGLVEPTILALIFFKPASTQIAEMALWQRNPLPEFQDVREGWSSCIVFIRPTFHIYPSLSTQSKHGNHTVIHLDSQYVLLHSTQSKMICKGLNLGL